MLIENASTWSNANSNSTEAFCHLLREDSVSMTSKRVTWHTNIIKLSRVL